MNVYVLDWSPAFEGPFVKGIYATEELANAAMQKLLEESPGYAGDLDVVEYEVEGSAE